jgi:hypothetical protein
MLFMIECSDPDSGVHFSKVCDAATAEDATVAVGRHLMVEGKLEDGDYLRTRASCLMKTRDVWGERYVADFVLARTGVEVTAKQKKGTQVCSEAKPSAPSSA